MTNNPSMSVVNDRLRILILLDACDAADLSPVPVMRIHALAFLANVLAPVWSEASYDGKILKRRDGPFYPELQRELDFLVGLGLVGVSNLQHIKIEGQWRFDGSFFLIEEGSRKIIELAHRFQAERATSEFFRRLMFAVVRIANPIEDLIKLDVTWADDRTGTGDVIDFAEWQAANYTAFAANFRQGNAAGSQDVTGGQVAIVHGIYFRKDIASALTRGVRYK